MLCNGLKVVDLFIVDTDNTDPSDHEHIRSQGDFYQVPDEPLSWASAKTLRDMINVVARVSERCGGPKNRFVWLAQVETGDLIEITDNNLLDGD